MSNKATILCETADGKRDYVSIQLKGLPIQVNAGIAELKQENRAELSKRIRREVSAIIDRPPFPSQSSFDEAVNQTTNSIIHALDQEANETEGLRVKRDDQGNIIKTLVHKSLDEEKSRITDILHDADKFRAPFILEIANREGLRFIVTEKNDIGSIIGAGQRDPQVEARTAYLKNPETGKILLQQVYISTSGKADSTLIPGGRLASPQIKLVNGFAHETIHNTSLEKLFTKKIAKGETAIVDKIISDDMANLQAINAKVKQALSISESGNPREDFIHTNKILELNGKLAPLFDLAMEGFDKRTLHSSLSAHDLRQAVKTNAIPSELPSGVTAQDYADGMREVVQTMSDHLKLPLHMMTHFPHARYSDRAAVLQEYPGQVFAMMAIKGIGVTECLLPSLTPILCDAVKQEYGIDPKSFTLPSVSQRSVHKQ